MLPGLRRAPAPLAPAPLAQLPARGPPLERRDRRVALVVDATDGRGTPVALAGAKGPPKLPKGPAPKLGFVLTRVKPMVELKDRWLAYTASSRAWLPGMSKGKSSRTERAAISANDASERENCRPEAGAIHGVAGKDSPTC
eukprot:scaffold232997_cov33-Tisochrysis_lutea.AAC.9